MKVKTIMQLADLINLNNSSNNTNDLKECYQQLFQNKETKLKTFRLITMFQKGLIIAILILLIKVKKLNNYYKKIYKFNSNINSNKIFQDKKNQNLVKLINKYNNNSCNNNNNNNL